MSKWIPAPMGTLVVKNVLMFVVIAVGLVVPVAWTYLETVEKLLTDTLAAQLAVVAQQGATMIDGADVVSLKAAGDEKTEAYKRLRATLALIQNEFDVDNAVVMRRTTMDSYAYVADGAGHFSLNEAVDLHQKFPETKPPADRAFRTGKLGTTGLFSSGGTKWFQVNAPLMEGGDVVGLLLINKFATPVAGEIARRQRQIVLGAVAVLVVGVALWWFFAVRMSRPLVALRNASLDIAGGNLDVHIDEVHSADEVGDLTRAYRLMVEDLRTSKGQIESYTQLIQNEKEAFYRFVPTQFLELLGRDSAMTIQLGDSSPRSMSVMFSDIRSFTTISEFLDAEKVFGFLNEYLARMEPAIERHGGFVNQFFGDGIMALFHDVEKERRTSADMAVNAAIAMRQELAAYNEFRNGNGQDSIRIGVGLHTGALVLGTIGSPTRLNTTVVGDTVNLASRLESLTSHYRVGVIVSESMHGALSNPGNYYLREIAKVQVKGKQQVVRLYDLFDWESPLNRERKQAGARTFADALERYRAGRFDEARKAFEAVLANNPEDRTAEAYVEQCRHHIRNPPADWEGVDVFLVK